MEKLSFGRTILLVDDYDKALEFYQRAFNCIIIYDELSPDGDRYLHIGFEENAKSGLWLIKDVSNPNLIGNQTGSSPFLVIYTPDIFQIYDHLEEENIELLTEIAITPQSKFFHCSDLYGNRIVIVER
ncbi:VOC family protein [Membranihabitans marinus]|uniref:VOC family protein n=1 Tax=Membranihabitans marinus TaxID=1227546 RepID=UPI001F448E1E|nr:VOC family protein [Membranihabitans marinus]